MRGCGQWLQGLSLPPCQGCSSIGEEAEKRQMHGDVEQNWPPARPFRVRNPAPAGFGRIRPASATSDRLRPAPAGSGQRSRLRPVGVDSGPHMLALTSLR